MLHIYPSAIDPQFRKIYILKVTTYLLECLGDRMTHGRVSQGAKSHKIKQLYILPAFDYFRQGVTRSNKYGNP
jgi:hypothetical protein